MDYLSESLSKLKSRITRQKRARNSPIQPIVKKKIHIIRPAHTISSNFDFSSGKLRSMENSHDIFDYLINPTLNSTEVIKSRIELIKDTMIYAQKKIRKLNSVNSTITQEFSEEEAQGIYKEWYSTETISEIQSLAPGQEIDEEIISDYIKLIPKPHSMHCLPPSLYKDFERILEKDWDIKKYQRSLKRTGITSILDKPYILLPVKEEDFWVLICINNENKTLEYFSSDLSFDFRVPCSKIEMLMKHTEDIEEYDWEIVDTPQGNSKHDSGVLMLLVIRSILLNSAFMLPLESVEYLRTLISLEIKNKAIFNY